jgi:hypothetical protein
MSSRRMSSRRRSPCLACCCLLLGYQCFLSFCVSTFVNLTAFHWLVIDDSTTSQSYENFTRILKRPSEYCLNSQSQSTYLGPTRLHVAPIIQQQAIRYTYYSYGHLRFFRLSTRGAENLARHIYRETPPHRSCHENVLAVPW